MDDPAGLAAPNPPRPRCALIGEALIDHLPQGPRVGGAPFNVARHLAALGAAPCMVTRIGRDAGGARITEAFTRFGLDRDGLQHDDRLPTGSVQVVMQDGSHRFEIGRDQAWDAIDEPAACAALRRAGPALVCFGTLAQRTPASREAIRAALDATPALRFLDLNLRAGADDAVLLRESIARAHVLKLNDDELARVLDVLVTPGAGSLPWGSAAQRTVMAELLRRAPLQRLIVTRGERGYAAFDAQGRVLCEGSTPAVQVTDTVGAGDAFTSICLIGHVHAWPLEQTLARAADFAAAVCTQPGAVPEDANFHTAWRERWRLPA